MSLLLALSVGCAMGPYGAPFGAQVNRPDDTQGMIFDVGYNDPDDGIGLLVKEYVMVTNEVAQAGDLVEVPLNNILVEITSGYSATYILPASAVSYVDDYETSCEGDRSEECDAWFDIGEERYIEFSGDYKDLGGFRPTYGSGGTDNRGVFEFYVFIDSVPVDDEGEVFPIPLFASIGVDTVTWSYDFQ